MVLVLVGGGAVAAVHWGLTASHTACRRRADARLDALSDALTRGAPVPEGRWQPTGGGERLLLLDDGAVLVDGDRIVGGGPVCPAPLW